MKIISLLIFLSSYPALGLEENKPQETELLIYRIHQEHRIFIHNPSKVLTISKSCGDDLARTQNCQAMAALKTVSMDHLTSDDLLGGKNPGSVLCSKSAKGQVVWGEDNSGSKTTFCQFVDDTLVSSGTLHYYANQNQKDVGGRK